MVIHEGIHTAREPGPIDYLVVEFPAGTADPLGEMVGHVTSLTESGVVRVVDLLFIETGTDGSFQACEPHDLDGDQMGSLVQLGLEMRQVLGEEDVEAIAAALEPGRIAGVLVWENLWAQLFVSEVRRSGGRLVAGGRILTEALPDSPRAIEDAVPGKQRREPPAGGRVTRPGVLRLQAERPGAVVGTTSAEGHGVDRRGDRRDSQHEAFEFNLANGFITRRPGDRRRACRDKR